MNIVKFEQIEDKIILIRGEKVILDGDVADIYGVETKRINEAVRNNQDKFPSGYLFEINETELDDLRSKLSTAKLAKTRVLPKAFTEKGLYMLATILSVTTACNEHDYPIPEWFEIGPALRVTFAPHPLTTASQIQTVPVNVLVNVPVNERQQWFLDQLEQGIQCKPVDIAAKWGVVEKIAKAGQVCSLLYPI